ncbi:anti-sigma factor [Streptomyces sp. FIT100]|uniref:anti-sigma factor n=1 Tax=Streptomyces sp. FIT100 TaxID=2837956 RepID=UPI0021C8E13D|nr:anti-sigma factor [Streptomyces sp. FIT100]UUN25910.1 anti-sigma factor [Streptomyces sp. FIT100]
MSAAGRDAELHSLTGAYALHALGERERARFERHLDACTACAQEVREFGATAVRLGLAAAETPPPAMKAALLARIATVRQEPPTVGGPRAEPPRVRPARPGGPGGQRRVFRFVLAACVAAAAAFGGVAVWQQRSADEARTEARRAQEQAAALAQVLTAPDVRTSAAALGDGGATGTVAVSRERDRAVFLASGLPRPVAGKVYQLWFADGSTMRPAGLLDSAGSPEALLMDGPVGRATAMGITVEPTGGSRTPTSEPLALLNLPAP